MTHAALLTTIRWVLRAKRQPLASVPPSTPAARAHRHHRSSNSIPHSESLTTTSRPGVARRVNRDSGPHHLYHVVHELLVAIAIAIAVTVFTVEKKAHLSKTILRSLSRHHRAPVAGGPGDPGALRCAESVSVSVDKMLPGPIPLRSSQPAREARAPTFRGRESGKAIERYIPQESNVTGS